MPEVTVSSKGQIVIPKELREELELKAGKKVAIQEVDGVLILIPVPRDPVEKLHGLTEGIFRKESVKVLRELREEWQ